MDAYKISSSESLAKRFPRWYASLFDKTVLLYGVADSESEINARPMHQNIWCPFNKEFFTATSDIGRPSLESRFFEMRLCHILPRSLGNANIATLLGLDDRERAVNRLANLIVLHKAVQEPFNKFRVTFVPRSPVQRGKMEYKMVVVDPELFSEPYPQGIYDPVFQLTRGRKTITWANLDGQSLQFRNDHRPSAQHLLCHAIMCFLRFYWSFTKHPSGSHKAWYKYLATQLFHGEQVWPYPHQLIRSHVLANLVSGADHYIPFDFTGPTNPSPGASFRAHYSARSIRHWISTLDRHDGSGISCDGDSEHVNADENHDDHTDSDDSDFWDSVHASGQSDPQDIASETNDDVDDGGQDSENGEGADADAEDNEDSDWNDDHDDHDDHGEDVKYSEALEEDDWTREKSQYNEERYPHSGEDEDIQEREARKVLVKKQRKAKRKMKEKLNRRWKERVRREALERQLRQTINRNNMQSESEMER